jgi:hypothetical protein
MMVDVFCFWLPNHHSARVAAIREAVSSSPLIAFHFELYDKDQMLCQYTIIVA